MGWKDLMKNVTDKATSVAETAQAKFEEQKQLSAIKKEEQNKKMEEMNERVTEYEQELLQNILSGFSGAPCIEVEDNILDFTKDYFEKLLLPANSVSASKITMYPYSDKIQKKAQKALRERGVLNPNHQKSRAHRLKMAALRYCQSYLYSLLAYRPQCCNK